MIKRKAELNIFTNDLEDILNDEWFTKILPESWESEDTIARTMQIEFAQIKPKEK